MTMPLNDVPTPPDRTTVEPAALAGGTPALDPDTLRRAILESAVDYAIFSMSLDGVVTSWNAGAQHLMGWSAEQMIGQRGHLMFTPSDVAHGQPEHEMRMALEHGRAVNERWHVRRDGSRFFGTGLLMPMRQEGSLVGFVKVMRDRTAALPHSQPAGEDVDARENPATPADPVARGRFEEVIRLKALAQAASAITAASGLVATLQTVADAVRNLIGAHQAAVSLTRGPDHAQEIAAVSLSDRYARWRGYAAATDGSGIYALVTRGNRPVRMTQSQLEAHPAWRGFGDHAADHPPMRGWLAVPLTRDDGRNLGLIQLSDRYESEFDEADEAIAMQLARFASAAIEQAESREALARSEERLRLAIEATRLGTWHYDPKSARLEWDECCGALFGVPPDTEVDYGLFLRALHPDDRERADKTVRDALEPGSEGRFAIEYRAIGLRDGIERWVSAHGQACGTDAQPRLIGTVLDITARKRAEQALRESEARFGLAARSSSLGHWEIEPRSRRLRWSDNARRMWGLDDAHGPIELSMALERLHPQDRPDVEAAMASAWDPAGDGEFRAQYRVVWPDGSQRWLDALGVSEFAGEDGGAGRRAVRLAGIVWDVTETRQLIESLQQADARKDEFLAMLAHELRNPLSALTNALRLLTHATPGPRADTGTESGSGGGGAGDDDAEDGVARKMLAIAERQVRQLRRLVDDLLEVSRITRGKIELRPERMEMGDAVRQAADAVAAEAQSRAQRLALRMPDHPVVVMADPVRIAQVLENLLNNACKYTPEGGSIVVEVEDRPGIAGKPAGEVVIRVVDNGIGIAAEELPRLFDLFTQVDATLDRAQGGLGIGLAMVKRLVEMHGGTVAAASAGRGRGATFTVRLPRPALPTAAR